MKTTAKETATGAYARRHCQAQSLAWEISQLIEDLPAPGTQPIDWGHVGDLARLCAVLEEAKQLLEGSAV